MPDVTGRPKLAFEKTERELAKGLLRVLDGVSISRARNALEHAIQLLTTSQIVNSDSPLLLIDALVSEEDAHDSSGRK
jgi:hypothetical protein